MLLVILQIILLAAWYAVASLQFVPWWIIWLPSLYLASIWVFWALFILVGSVINFKIGNSHSTLRSR